jgi:DNA repair protein RecO (recombination protein O)
MSIVKSLSLVLATAPYRESSLLLHLFSRQLGRIHGLAKGIRRGDKRCVPIERGTVIEHMVYIKQQRDLHLVTDCQINECYPGIRKNLEKTAIRDVMLDVLLGAIKDTEPHEELYDGIVNGFEHLEGDFPAGNDLLLFLARQLFVIARRLGFGVDFTRCAACGNLFERLQACVLVIDSGICFCPRCMPHVKGAQHRGLGAGVLPLSDSDILPLERTAPVPAVEEAMSAVCAAVDFCRYHLDLRRKLASVTFLDHLFTMASADGSH